MFNKGLKKKQLEKIKAEIIKEKQELEEIKRILEEKTDKIDISNVYVFTYGELSYLVTIEEVKNFKNFRIIKDVFSKNTLFKSVFISPSSPQEMYIFGKDYNGKDLKASVKPILEVHNELIKYVDKQVPVYVLQQLLFKLNKLDSNNKKRRF